MKKVLFLGLAFVATMGLSAQEVKKALPARVLTNVEMKEADFHSTEMVKGKYPARALSVDVMTQAKKSLTTGGQLKKVPFVKKSAGMSMSTKATDAAGLLNGTFYIQAMSVSEQAMRTWTVDVRKDETEANKYWFTDLSGYLDFEDVYGIVENDTVLTIPNQYIGEAAFEGVSGKGQLRLVGFEVNGTGEAQTMDTISEIKAILHVEDEIISFSTYYGIYIANAQEIGLTGSWVEAYMGAVMFTENAIPLSANYIHPQGTLFYGLSEPSMLILSDLQATAAPDVTWEWYNLTDDPAASFEWNYDKYEYDEDGNETIIPQATSNEVNLKMQVKYGDVYTYPTLTASAGDETSVFSYGSIDAGDDDLFVKDAENLVLINAGGGTGALLNGTSYEYCHLTNWNMDAGLMFGGFAEKSYYFGTYSDTDEDGNVRNVDALYSRFEAPLKPLSFMAVNVIYGVCTPETLPLTMAVQEYTYNENGEIVLGDTIATSDTYDLSKFRIQFYDFKAKDEDGFISTLEEVSVDPQKGFFLVLGGFNQPGADFAVRSEAAARPDGEIYSYFKFKNSDGSIEPGLYSWINIPLTMYMELAYAIYGEDPTTGIASVESSNTTKLFSTADAFNFAYTDDFTSVDVYNVNGQKVSSYALPQTGTFSIAKAGLADGVYMFRMNGKTTEVLRAVK